MRIDIILLDILFTMSSDKCTRLDVSSIDIFNVSEVTKVFDNSIRDAYKKIFVYTGLRDVVIKTHDQYKAKLDKLKETNNELSSELKHLNDTIMPAMEDKNINQMEQIINLTEYVIPALKSDYAKQIKDLEEQNNQKAKAIQLLENENTTLLEEIHAVRQKYTETVSSYNDLLRNLINIQDSLLAKHTIIDTTMCK